MKRKITNCPICQNLDLKFLEGYEKKFLIKCKKCSFVFDQRIPSSHELDEYYSNYAYNNLKQVSPQTINSFNKLLDFFEKNNGLSYIHQLQIIYSLFFSFYMLNRYLLNKKKNNDQTPQHLRGIFFL